VPYAVSAASRSQVTPRPAQSPATFGLHVSDEKRDQCPLRNGSDLDRPTGHQMSEPEPLRPVLARISDDGHRAGDEQPA
jgi:hypothetical protein